MKTYFRKQSDGTIVSFADESSEMIVFEGVTDSTKLHL